MLNFIYSKSKQEICILIVGGMHMTWEVKINAEFGFIESVFKGTITKQDSTDVIVEALTLATGDGPHMFLTDVLNAES